MREAVEQTQREERENRRKLRAARKRTLEGDGQPVKTAHRYTTTKLGHAAHHPDWRMEGGLNIEDALGLATFNEYKEGTAVLDYHSITLSLRLELLNTMGAEEVKAGMDWGTPLMALKKACRNRPAFSFDGMLRIDCQAWDANREWTQPEPQPFR
ncbi:hypothetical protein BDV27DRAFT_157036 [Aspergillus caelatus]|uniref:Uncharacterized protein n=1 Tax=Aspergillus caelatus TaxID=61420 RepID=A0A5N7A643_9EURO|nr:uncharacterized protein BDV27DRAFT_157036 [Aspergillus caelatus]KAE8365337.1 hypothetical protein BDV27DRAFT_157036 [Aspergillus caelatus]